MLNNSVAEVSGSAASNVESKWNFFQPYADFDADFLYNSLFCDSLPLFRRDLPTATAAPWTAVLAEPPPLDILQALIADDRAPGRLRALACERLRATGHDVVGRAVLAVIVEFPLVRGQDTLAVWADGSVCYIRHSGAASLFECDGSSVAARARKLVAAARRLQHRFGTPQSHRPPPPQGDRIRISLITCGGRYCSEGSLQALQKDAVTGAVLGNAIWLLQAHARLAAENGGDGKMRPAQDAKAPTE
jgi:hypothetical protein